MAVERSPDTAGDLSAAFFGYANPIFQRDPPGSAPDHGEQAMSAWEITAIFLVRSANVRIMAERVGKMVYMLAPFQIWPFKKNYSNVFILH